MSGPKRTINYVAKFLPPKIWRPLIGPAKNGGKKLSRPTGRPDKSVPETRQPREIKLTKLDPCGGGKGGPVSKL